MWIESALWIAFLAATVRLAAPLVLAALGETFAERSGVLNLAVEGLMLLGAFVAYAVAGATRSGVLGLGAAIATGAVLGLGLGVLYVSLRLDQVVVGLAANIALIGLSALLYRLAYGDQPFRMKVEGFEVVSIPYLAALPGVGPILFQHSVMVYGALLLIPLSSVVLFRTQFGLHVRAAGENPEAPDTLGVNVAATRQACVAIGGALAAAGGAFLTLAHVNLFVEEMTAGRGWIAIACVVFGRWTPSRVAAGALLFGAADALQLRLQAGGSPLPFQILSMLPYVLPILALMSVGRRASLPAALGVPYVRGERR